jgi:hypothetical protein
MFSNKNTKTVLIISIILLILLASFVLSSGPQVEDIAETPITTSLILNTEGLIGDPQIAVSGNSTYLVWEDNSTGNDEIYLKLSPAGRALNLSRNNGSSSDPQIAVSGNSTYVVWKDNSTGNDEIYLKLSPAGKSDFGRMFNLSRNNGSSSDPQIAVSGNSTYVVWKDNSTGVGDEIYSREL